MINRPAGSTPSRRNRPVLTGRALVLGGLIVALVVVLASPVSRYLGSRSAVGSAAQQLHDDRAELAELKKQKALYADPGYIQQQARQKLEFAMPGDTVYHVTGRGGQNEIERTRSESGDTKVAGNAWNTRLWDSVRAADG